MSVRNGRWSRWPFGARSMLSRMSLGVVGYGRLGKKVASYGQCFGVDVYYFDPYVYEFFSDNEMTLSLISNDVIVDPNTGERIEDQFAIVIDFERIEN